jgi:DNA-directed RNA polymerase specialized sigma subunit
MQMQEKKRSAAQEHFLQVKMFDTHINDKLEELAMLQDMVMKITASYSTELGGGSGSQDKLGDAVAKIIDLQAEINEAVDAYVDKKREVSRTLEQVQDADQVAVLHKRYFLYEPWEQIACEMNMTYRNVCYIHGKALDAVKRILERKQE